MADGPDLAPGATVQVHGLSVAAAFRVEAADDLALTLVGPDLGFQTGDHVTVGHLVGWRWTAAAGRIAFAMTPSRRRAQIGIELTQPMRTVERRLGYRAELAVEIELLVPASEGLVSVRGTTINLSTSGAAVRTEHRPVTDVQVPALVLVPGDQPIAAVARIVGVTAPPRSAVRLTFDQMLERDRRRLGRLIQHHVLGDPTAGAR